MRSVSNKGHFVSLSADKVNCWQRKKVGKPQELKTGFQLNEKGDNICFYVVFPPSFSPTDNMKTKSVHYHNS